MNKIIYSLDKNKSYIIAFLIITECIFLFFTYKSFNDRVETIDKTSVVKKEKYSMYIKDGNNYVAYNATNTFPDGYVLNLSESYCVDGNDTRVNNAITKTDDKVTVTSNQTLFCTLYFDQDMHFASYLRNLCSSDNTIVAYNGKVTDDVSQIGEGVDATKVCAFRSNTNNNVVFANHCWQIRRTTETGGVKIQYNGEPTLGTDGSGNTTYDCGTSRPYHMGSAKPITSYTSLSGNYLYGDSYTTNFDGTTTTFTLTNTQSVQVTSSNASSVIPTLSGKYTCKNSTGTCTNSGLYKVDSWNTGTNAYVYQSTFRDSLGNSGFNWYRNSVSDIGYMYNTRYPAPVISISPSIKMLTTLALSSSNLTNHGNYLYADSYSMSGTNHVLTNAVLGNTIADYPTSWAGKYRCNSSTNSTCSTMYYVSGIDTSGTNPILYYTTIESGKEFNDVSYTYLFADGIADNGDGTFTMTTPQEIYLKDWYTNYSSLNNKYVCLPGYWNESNGIYTCSDNGAQDVGALRYVTATSSTSITAAIIYKYGFGIVQNGNSYRLTAKVGEEQTLQYVTNWPNSSTENCFANGTTKLSTCGFKTLSKSHYTCLNLTGECINYYYITYTTNASLNMAQISGGKYASTDITDTSNILYEMLTRSDINTTDSTIKEVIDLWYQNNLSNSSYESLIDLNSIFCNDRTVIDFGTFNPDGGNPHSNYNLKFRSFDSGGNLSCGRGLDAFSTNNNLAKLSYPIALMTHPELYILSIDARSSANSYWDMSPIDFHASNSLGGYVNSEGNRMTHENVQSQLSVRPAIVLNSNAEFSSGTGSTSDPFVITGSEMTVSP